MNKEKLYLLGDGEALSKASVIADSVWPRDMLIKIQLQSPDRFHYVIPDVLLAENTANVSVFAALDEMHLGYKRLTFLEALIDHGYKLANLVSPLARIESNVELMGNVLVSSGCSVAHEASLGLGSWLDSSVTVSAKAVINKSCTLKSAAFIGERSKLGVGTIIGSCVILAEDTEVGNHCELNVRQNYPSLVPDKTLFDPLYENGATIFDLGD